VKELKYGFWRNEDVVFFRMACVVERMEIVCFFGDACLLFAE
jgi:hypothetical protein